MPWFTLRNLRLNKSCRLTRSMASYTSTDLQYRRAPTAREGVSKDVKKAPPAIFQRSMMWRQKRDKKIQKMRRQQMQDNGGKKSFILSNHEYYKDASVGEHIDAYHRYNMLVGESDGGNPLPEKEYKELERKCAVAAKDRLFATWRNIHEMDCVNIGPMTRCFCGHSYRAHAFYRNKSKRVHCRVPGCKCALFHYVYHRGGRAVRCQCKHELNKHRDTFNRPTACQHRHCKCSCFAPTVTVKTCSTILCYRF